MYAGTFLIWLGFSVALWQYVYLESHIQRTAAAIGYVQMNRQFLYWTNHWTLAVQAGVCFYAIATLLYNGADNARRWKETVAAAHNAFARVRNFFRKS